MPLWITCQLGAREHYAIPRALHQAGQLHTLITDAWVNPQSSIHRLPGKVAKPLIDRYHPDLATADISDFTRSLIRFELQQRLTRTTGWPNTLARNQWFQRLAVRTLEKLETQFSPNNCPILFSYSYTALEIFRYAKQRGWRTILGQIDPGIIEEQQVAQLQATYGQQYHSTWTPAPAHYWQTWQQECALADQIIVNSPWAQKALMQVGIPNHKITIIPLAYQAPAVTQTFTRTYPNAFTAQRPLRVLFLGQIILRKGIAALLEAAELLQDDPIEFWLIGASEINLSKHLNQKRNIKHFGAIPRSQVQNYYQQADVFLFPTHSDGFGLTQLEAQAWQLPIIASSYCGAVVKHRENGLLLAEVSATAIAESLKTCLANPQQLQKFADQYVNMTEFNLEHLCQALNRC